MAADMVGAEESKLLQQLERAQARAEEIRRHLERADQVIARPINGQDGEGAVEIVLGADGNVEAVHLDPDWRELVADRGLPAAVTEAFRAAHGSRLSDWCGALRESLSARGRVPLGHRADAEPPEGLELDGPDPDLSGITTAVPDEQVAAEVREALNRAPRECATGATGSDPVGEPALHDQVTSSFGALSAAIAAAPGWLDITLVVAGAQTALGMLRELTEQVLPLDAADANDHERLARGLRAAAARARSLLGIPEAVGLVLTVVAELLAAQRAGTGSAHHRLSVG